MKVFKVFLTMVLAASMLTVSALAAEFIPSAEQDGTYLVSAELNEVDTPCRTVLLIPYGNIHLEDIIDEERLDIEYTVSEEMEAEIRDRLTKARAELKDGSLNTQIDGFAKEWEALTGGAPLSNAVVYDLFEIVLICSEVDAFKTDEQVTVHFKVEGIEAGDLFLIAHKPTGSDKWVLEEYEMDETGVIKMTLDQLSPFAVITDNGDLPAVSDDAPDSPKTGVEYKNYVLPMIGCAVIALGAVFGIRKTGKSA